MKRKFLATAVLSIAGLMAITGCASTSSSTTETGSTTGQVEVLHNITLGSIGKGAYVTLSNNKAVEGTEIIITVVLTDTQNYLLGEVKLGSDVITMTALENDKNVYTGKFNVGATDCVISVATTKIEEAVLITHRINVTVEGAGAYAVASTREAPQGAEVGLTVVLTDSANYTIDTVKLNGASLTGKVSEDNTNVILYTIQVTDVDANIIVTTKQISNLNKEFAITTNGSEHVVFAGLNSMADEGEIVEFGVTPLNGYAIKSIKVTYEILKEETIENTTDKITKEVIVNGNANEGYSFTMPKASVNVEVIAVGAYFHLTESADKIKAGLNQNEYSVKDVIDHYIDPNTKEAIAPGDTRIFFQAGEKVQFVPKHHSELNAEKYFINGVEASEVAVEEKDKPTATRTFEFIMPAEDAKISSNISEREITVNISAPSFVALKCYTKGENDAEILTDKIKIGQEYFIETKIEGENKFMDAISGTVKTYTSETGYAIEDYKFIETDWMDTNEFFGPDFLYVDPNTKKFVWPTDNIILADNVLNISISAGDPVFDCEAVGEYFGYNASFGSKGGSTTTRFNVVKTGAVDSNGSSINKTKMKIDSENNMTLTKSGNTRKVWYENGLMAFSYSSSDDGINTQEYYNDFFFFAKNATKTDRIAIYHNGSKGRASWQYIVQFYTPDPNNKNNSLETKGFIFVDGSGFKVIPNATVTFTAGKLVTDQMAEFTVTKDGTTLLTKTAAPKA